MSNVVTVLIRTIGRKTLANAIESALTEFAKVIVVADSIDLDTSSLPKGDIQYVKLGRKFGKYGNAGINVGAYLCETPYFCLLDDDDEFIPGAGKKMLSCIKEKPEVDIWIPGLKYEKSNLFLCLDHSQGVMPGNIAVPTYKTELLFEFPFNLRLEKANPDLVDFVHVATLVRMGYKISWYGSLLYTIRPELTGTNGRGV